MYTIYDLGKVPHNKYFGQVTLSDDSVAEMNFILGRREVPNI